MGRLPREAMDFRKVESGVPQVPENPDVAEGRAERTGIAEPGMPRCPERRMPVKQAFDKAETAPENGGEKDVERAPFHPGNIHSVPGENGEHSLVPEKGRHADGRFERFRVADGAAGEDFAQDHEIERQAVAEIPVRGGAAVVPLGIHQAAAGFGPAAEDVFPFIPAQADGPAEEEGNGLRAILAPALGERRMGGRTIGGGLDRSGVGDMGHAAIMGGRRSENKRKERGSAAGQTIAFAPFVPAPGWPATGPAQVGPSHVREQALARLAIPLAGGRTVP